MREKKKGSITVLISVRGRLGFFGVLSTGKRERKREKEKEKERKGKRKAL